MCRVAWPASLLFRWPPTPAHDNRVSGGEPTDSIAIRGRPFQSVSPTRRNKPAFPESDVTSLLTRRTESTRIWRQCAGWLSRRNGASKWFTPWNIPPARGEPQAPVGEERGSQGPRATAASAKRSPGVGGEGATKHRSERARTPVSEERRRHRTHRALEARPHLRSAAQASEAKAQPSTAASGLEGP